VPRRTVGATLAAGGAIHHFVLLEDQPLKLFPTGLTTKFEDGHSFRYLIGKFGSEIEPPPGEICRTAVRLLAPTLRKSWILRLVRGIMLLGLGAGKGLLPN